MLLRPEVAVLSIVALLTFVFVNLSTLWIAREFGPPAGRWETLFAGAIIGIVVGQISLIGVWSTLTLQRAAVRFWGALALLAGVYVLLLAGWYFVRRLNGEDMAVWGGLVVVCFATTQLPLWFARLFGWRFIREPDIDGYRLERKRQFRIKHVMAAMLLSALLLAAWQWGVVEVLPELLLVNPLPSLPWVWIAFQPRRRLLRRALVATSVTGLLTATQLWILPFTIGGLLPPMELFVIAINLSQTLTVAGVLLLFRWDGYRFTAK